MKPRIAIPVPTSFDPAYNQKSWPAYARAVTLAGGDPVEVPLNVSPAQIANLVNTCQGILLPGSPADVNPHKYGHERDAETAAPDHARENVDELLLQDAHNLHKPLLAICFGCQSLNVWRGGTLVQHLAPMPVNHRAGASVAIAHSAAIAPDSLLSTLLTPEEAPLPSPAEPDSAYPRLPINSSHHQALGIPGDGLRVIARCPQDGVIEAVEGGQTATLVEGGSHFVLGLQWHPERSYDISPASRAIFQTFLTAASTWVPRPIHTSIA